jgi:hypothetical protein
LVLGWILRLSQAYVRCAQPGLNVVRVEIARRIETVGFEFGHRECLAETADAAESYGRQGPATQSCTGDPQKSGLAWIAPDVLPFGQTKPHRRVVGQLIRA